MSRATQNTVNLADVNVLVYAFDEEAHDHSRYLDWLSGVLGARRPFALVDTVLAGFVRVVTNPRIFEHPARTSEALSFVDGIIESTASVWLQSDRAAWNGLGALVEDDPTIRGTHIPDAYLAALAIANGARLATADRGFARYPGLDWFDPAKS